MPPEEVKLASLSFLYTYIDAISTSLQLEKTELSPNFQLLSQEDLQVVLQHLAFIFMFILSNIVIFCNILNPNIF